MISKYLYVSLKEDYFPLRILVILIVILIPIGLIKNDPQTAFSAVLFYTALNTVLVVSTDRRFGVEDFIKLSVFIPLRLMFIKVICACISNSLLFIYLIVLCLYLQASFLTALICVFISFSLYQLLAVSFYYLLGHSYSLLALAGYFIITLGSWPQLETVKYLSPGIQFVNLNVLNYPNLFYLLLLIFLLLSLLILSQSGKRKIFSLLIIALFCVGFASVLKYEHSISEKISNMEFKEKIINGIEVKYRGVPENYADTYGLLTVCLQNELHKLKFPKYPIQITAYQLSFFGADAEKYKPIPVTVEDNIQKINVFSAGMLNMDYQQFAGRVISNRLLGKDSLTEELKDAISVYIQYKLLESPFKNRFSEKQRRTIEFNYHQLNEQEIKEIEDWYILSIQ